MGRKQIKYGTTFPFDVVESVMMMMFVLLAIYTCLITAINWLAIALLIIALITFEWQWYKSKKRNGVEQNEKETKS